MHEIKYLSLRIFSFSRLSNKNYQNFEYKNVFIYQKTIQKVRALLILAEQLNRMHALLLSSSHVNSLTKYRSVVIDTVCRVII